MKILYLLLVIQLAHPFEGKKAAIVVGNIITDIANIIAITADPIILSGICVDWPFITFEPTALPAYCIGTLLSANEKNIVTAKSAITPTKNNNISIIDISPAVFKV